MNPLAMTAAVLLAPAAAPAQAWTERQVLAMGTSLALEVHAAERAVALAASEHAVRAAAAVEHRLSVWRDDSDVARVNRGEVGRVVAVDPATAADLGWAFDLTRAAAGAFDPTVGPLVQAYGLREGGRWPDAATLAAARSAVGIDGFLVGEAGVVRRRADAALDCDAFGKGVALDRAAASAIAAGARGVLLDFGGQILLQGDIGRELWLPLVHPLDRERVVAELRLRPGRSAATSGNGERREFPAGRRLGHLIDPRTGRPAPDFGSVTAIAGGAALADAAATALFVLGPGGAAVTAVGARLGVEAVVVEFAGDAGGSADRHTPVRVRATPGLRNAVRACGAPVEFLPVPSQRQRP